MNDIKIKYPVLKISQLNQLHKLLTLSGHQNWEVLGQSLVQNNRLTTFLKILNGKTMETGEKNGETMMAGISKILTTTHTILINLIKRT